MVNHLKCGLHSGFPACCISWYIITTPIIDKLYDFCAVPWDETKEDNGKFQFDKDIGRVFLPTWVEKIMDLRAGGHVGYIRCPLCLLLNRKVEVLSCDCSKAI